MKINEIYQSIEGEMSYHHQGAITTFIRFQGCNLKCRYCDSRFTWDPHGGHFMSPKEIMDKVEMYGNNNVTITGGEPLAQKAGIKALLKRLYDERYVVSVETNGTYVIPWEIQNKATWVVDWKWDLTRRQKEKLLYTVCNDLAEDDTVKFIISNIEEFKLAIEEKTNLEDTITHSCFYPKFALSPAYGKVSAKGLVKWMLALNPKQRENLYLNTQLHKYIWLTNERRV